MCTSARTAELRLSTLNMRTTPIAQAKVIYVSADKLPGEGRASSSISPASSRRQAELKAAIGEKLMPGLPAEVYVKSGERTLLRVHPEADPRQHGPRAERELMPSCSSC